MLLSNKCQLVYFRHTDPRVDFQLLLCDSWFDLVMCRLVTRVVCSVSNMCAAQETVVMCDYIGYCVCLYCWERHLTLHPLNPITCSVSLICTAFCVRTQVAVKLTQRKSGQRTRKSLERFVSLGLEWGVWYSNCRAWSLNLRTISQPIKLFLMLHAFFM